jgi:hypothetical protein
VTTTTTAHPHTPSATTTNLTRRRRAATVGVAVIASVAIWLVAVPLLGIDLRVAQAGGRPPLPIGLPAVIVTSLAASLAGWGLLSLLERLTGRARTLWTAAATAVLVLSFVPLLLGPTTATSTRVVLGLMHVTVGAVLIPTLPRTAAADPAS